MIRSMFGDLSALPLDAPIPLDVIDAAQGNTNDFATRGVIAEHLAARIRAERLTVRQLWEAIAEGCWQLGVIGTPAMVADRMEEWFADTACDGFIVQPPNNPGAALDFIDMVVPELQRRGLFRHDYEGTTLRHHLGLPRPAGMHAAAD